MNWYKKSKQPKENIISPFGRSMVYAEKSYYDIGHDNYILWFSPDGNIIEKSDQQMETPCTGLTHCDVAAWREYYSDASYRGRYDTTTKEITIICPKRDAPQGLINNLLRSFPYAKKIHLFDSYNTHETIRVASIKYAQQGEWWVIGGQSQFADANIGDMNHSGYVIDAILSNYDLEPERFDLTKEDEKSLRSKGLNEEEIDVVLDKVDPRVYGMEKLGWKRVAGINIQTQTLTESDLKDISNGLWDAYEQEIEADNELEFNIEVMGNNTYYSSVPYSVISSHNPIALREYGRVYAFNLAWYKFAQIWNVPTSDDIQDKIAELYELEYKHSALRDRPFVGVEERKQNILRELESRLGGVVDDVKEILSNVFSKWLNSHALLSADTWANQRADEFADENDPENYGGTEMSYQGMIGEYIRYAVHGGEFHRITDEKSYDRYFIELINKALRDLRNFPNLSKLVSGGLYDYKNMLMDELQSDGLKEFRDRYGKKFRNQDSAENWINSLTVNDVDAESIFYFDSIKGFVDMAHNLGYEREILAELYKKFVFPYWVKYWRQQGIAETRKTIANIYKKLQGISSSNIGNAMAVISLALNASHQTGEMLSYIGDEDEIRHVLEVMTKGINVDKWNQELREVGVQI